MSLKDDSHWRDPPTDRVDPSYPPNLTIRFEHTNLSEIGEGNSDETVIYDNANPDDRWVQAIAMPLDAML